MKLNTILGYIFILLLTTTSTVNANDSIKSNQLYLNNVEAVYGATDNLELDKSSYLVAALNSDDHIMVTKQNFKQKEDTSSNVFIKAIAVGAIIIALTTDDSEIATGTAILGVTLLVVDF